MISLECLLQSPARLNQQHAAFMGDNSHCTHTHTFLWSVSLKMTIFFNFFFAEIRSLDSEMQTLVYENYNKFISATDTIRKVNNALIIQSNLT